MAHPSSAFFRIGGPLLQEGFLNIETLAGAKTLVQGDSYYQALDPDGADRDGNLPAEKDGIAYHIRNNGAANNIVVKNDAGGTVVTLAATESAIVACDGTNWIEFQGK